MKEPAHKGYLLIALMLGPLCATAGAPTNPLFAVNRGTGISGKHDPNTPVLLLRSTPPSLCKAKTNQVTSQRREAGPTGEVFTTTLHQFEAPCRGNESNFLGIVGQSMGRFGYLPQGEEMSSNVRAKIDQTIRHSPEFGDVLQTEKATLDSRRKMNAPVHETMGAQIGRMLADMDRRCTEIEASPQSDQMKRSTPKERHPCRAEYEVAERAARDELAVPSARRGEQYREPALLKLSRLDLFGTTAYLAKYSRIAVYSTNTYFLVAHNRVFFVGGYDMEDAKSDAEMHFFTIEGRSYLYVSGLGQGGNYLLDRVLSITSEGLEQIYFNDDFAT